MQGPWYLPGKQNLGDILHSRSLSLLAVAHVAGIFLGFRTDQLFGLVTLGLSLLFLRYYYEKKIIPFTEIIGKFPLFVFSVCWLLLWLAVVFLEYFSFQYNLADTGIFAHQLIYYSKKGDYYNYILGLPALSDHFTPGLLIFTPLFQLKESILWLPLLRLFSYALSVIFLYKIAVLLFHKERGYVVLAVLLWLFNSAFLRVLRYEFHPSSLAVGILFGAFYLLLKGHKIKAYLTLLPLIFFKENLILVYLSFGLYLLLYEKEAKSGLVYMFSFAIFGFLIYFSIPFFTGGVPLVQGEKFGPFTLWGQKINFVLRLLTTVLLLPALRPSLFLVFLSSTAASLASRHPPMVSLTFHYQDIPVSIGMLMAVVALRDMREGKIKIWLSWGHMLKPIMVLLFLWENSLTPVHALRQALPQAHHLVLLGEIQQVKKKLPHDATLVVEDSLGPYFLEFPYLRSLRHEEWEDLMAGKTPTRSIGKVFVIFAEGVNPWPLTKEKWQGLAERLSSEPFHELESSFRYLKIFEKV
ncbi:MAG: DUF2079 domain-containing protein [Leptospiraceae bacterium]|nr:DUF2079 domain-containing protein [Leptospiraceae bacterium]